VAGSSVRRTQKDGPPASTPAALSAHWQALRERDFAAHNRTIAIPAMANLMAGMN